MASFQNVFLNGVGSAGKATFGVDGIEFRDQGNQLRKTVDGKAVLKSFVTNYGNKGQLHVVMKDGNSVQLDGFMKEDLEKIRQQMESKYAVSCEKSEVLFCLHSTTIRHSLT
jgi:hypothetical protein